MTETQALRKQQLIDLVKELIAKEGEVVRSLVRVHVYPSSIATFAVTYLCTHKNEYDKHIRQRKSFWAYFSTKGDSPELVEAEFQKWPPKIKIRVPETSSKSLDEWADWLQRKER